MSQSLRRLALALWLLLCLVTPSWAVLATSDVWEVRASGASDNNGGAFKAGAAGTDRSQQNAAQVAIDNAAITTSIAANVITFTGGYSPSAADVGNVVHMLTGTNVTAGWYEITSEVAGTSWTVTGAAALPTSGTTTNATGNMGGALSTLGTLSGAMVAGNWAFLTGAFTTTTTNTFAQNLSPPSTTTPASRLIGYGASRGDTGHATLTLQTNTGLVGLNFTGFGWQVDQVDVNCASLGTSKAIQGAAYFNVHNCKVSNFASFGIVSSNTDCNIVSNEVTGGLSGGKGINIASTGNISYNFVHDNACTGIGLATGCKVVGNLVVNNSGASSDGISFDDSVLIRGNTCHNNGRHGLHFVGTFPVGMVIQNNLLSNNGGWGFLSDFSFPASPYYDGNAYYSNTSGTRSNLDNTTGLYAVNLYTNVLDVILTASPYVGPTTGTTANFALNDVPGGGQACRRAGSPASWSGNTGSTSYPDMGAVQTRSNIRIPRAAPFPTPKPKQKAVLKHHALLKKTAVPKKKAVH